MQDQDFKFLLENVVSANRMAKHLHVSEEIIQDLCETGLLKAKYINEGWAILGNQELPCLLQFENVIEIDNDNFNILKGKYDLASLEELAYWPIALMDDGYYIGFQNICIDKGAFKDPSGKLHTKYILEIELFLNVTSWDNSLDSILFEVSDTISPIKSEFVAVFDIETDAYKCANKLFPELPLEEVITRKYISKLSLDDEMIY